MIWASSVSPGWGVRGGKRGQSEMSQASARRMVFWGVSSRDEPLVHDSCAASVVDHRSGRRPCLSLSTSTQSSREYHVPVNAEDASMEALNRYTSMIRIVNVLGKTRASARSASHGCRARRCRQTRCGMQPNPRAALSDSVSDLIS